MKCNKKNNDNKPCKNDIDIEKALQNMYLTLFHSETNLNFEHTDESPLLVSDGYHSQVQLSLKKYVDNNNFLRLNHVTLQQ